MGRASRRKRGDADVRRRERNPLQLKGRAHMLPTRWNGEPCEARRCRVEVGDPPFELDDYWGADIVGEIRLAVEIRIPLGTPGFRDFKGVGVHELRCNGGPWPPEGESTPKGAKVERVFYIDDASFEPTDRMRDMADSIGMDPDRIPRGYIGHGWDKVTKGRGAARYAHRDLWPRRVVEYLDELGIPLEEDGAAA